VKINLLRLRNKHRFSHPLDDEVIRRGYKTFQFIFNYARKKNEKEKRSFKVRRGMRKKIVETSSS
jgi:hypothetical protein